MRNLRVILPVLGLAALMATGCFITSGQIFAEFALTNPFTINSSTDPFERVLVDLNTVGEYADHKDKLNGLADFAVVGKFTNVAGPAGAVEVWITADNTNLGSVGAVQASATKLWGPGAIGPTGDVRVVDWDASAALFNSAGKQILINEALGDGVFTLYTFGTAGTYDIRVDDGFLILVINAGV